MYRNLPLIVSIIFATHLLGMKEEIETNTQEKDTPVRIIRDQSDSPFIDGFFFDNDSIIVAYQNGVCNKIDMFSSVNEQLKQKTVFVWPGVTGKPEMQLKNIMYNPETKSLLALSTLATISKQNHGYINPLRFPKPNITQGFIIKKLFDQTPRHFTQMMGQIITFVDPKFTFLASYSLRQDTYIIWSLNENTDKSQQLYPNTKNTSLINSITFHTPKKLCLMSLYAKSYETTVYIEEPHTNGLFHKNREEIKLISTESWTTIWKKPMRACTMCFDPQGISFASDIKGNLHLINIETGNIITKTEIPEIIQKISSITYSEDEKEIIIADESEIQAVFTHDGKYLRVEDIIGEEEQKIVHSSDRTLKAVIEPHKITVYKNGIFNDNK